MTLAADLCVRELSLSVRLAYVTAAHSPSFRRLHAPLTQAGATTPQGRLENSGEFFLLVEAGYLTTPEVMGLLDTFETNSRARYAVRST